MNQIDIEKRVEDLRASSVSHEENTKHLKNPNVKECPFSGKACGLHCKLFREKHSGYECPLQEIPSISWNLSQIMKRFH